MNRGLAVVVAALSVAGLILFMVQPEPEGKELFRAEGCINCHSFRGSGGEMGPDLTSVTRRRSEGWISEQIRNPRKHNPDSRMPSFDYLSGRQINAIIRYLRS